jgi:hypothetical protein
VYLGGTDALFYRAFSTDWFPDPLPSIGDELYCVRLFSPSDLYRSLPKSDIEGQMLFFRKDKGWVSQVLTGMVPVREVDYKFAPIIHMAQYIGMGSETETITLFMNLKNAPGSGPSDAGILNAEVSALCGTYLKSFQYPVQGNTTLAIRSDNLLNKLDLSKKQAEEGVNIKFWGGSSQFVILTLYFNRENGSIGVEHSLAPVYYIPEILNSAVRSLVYEQLKARP